MIIWGCKVLSVNKKYGETSLDYRMSTDTLKVLEPLSIENTPHHYHGYFMGY